MWDLLHVTWRNPVWNIENVKKGLLLSCHIWDKYFWLWLLLHHSLFYSQSWWYHILYSAAGKTFQLYSHNLIGLFDQLKKPGLAAQFQTHRFPDKILPRWDQQAWLSFFCFILFCDKVTTLRMLLHSRCAVFLLSLSNIMTDCCSGRKKKRSSGWLPLL